VSSSGGGGAITLLNSNTLFAADELIVGQGGSFAQQSNGTTRTAMTRLNGGTISVSSGTFATSDFFHDSGHLGLGTYTIGGQYRFQNGSIGNATINSNGTFTYNGGTAQGGKLINRGTFLFNPASGSLNLNFENRGQMIFNGQDLNVLSFDNITTTTTQLPADRTLRATSGGFGVTISTGTFAQSGTVIADNFRIRGATWLLEDGTLSASNSSGLFLVGEGAVNGTFRMTSGEAFFAGDLKVGALSSTGSFLQDFGRVTATKAPIIGAQGGSGFFRINDGTFSAGGLVVGQAGAIAGNFEQNGGHVSVGTMVLSENGLNPGNAEFNGGSFNVGSTAVNNWFINQTAGEITFGKGLTGTGGIGSVNGLIIATHLEQETVYLAGTGHIMTTAGADHPSIVAELDFDGPGNGIAGSWDLGDGKLVITDLAATPISQIRRFLSKGYNNGDWNGVGLSSSAAAQAASENTALGFMQVGSEVVVLYTLYGDANLSGGVNINDFSILAANFNEQADWFDGDFNYDGSTGITDFALLAANFNQILSAAPSAGQTVPEPGVIGALVALTSMRRRHNRA
jgi:hypothetical protein